MSNFDILFKEYQIELDALLFCHLLFLLSCSNGFHNTLFRNVSSGQFTHNLAITPMADRVISVRNSRVASNTVNPAPVPVETIEW